MHALFIELRIYCLVRQVAVRDLDGILRQGTMKGERVKAPYRPFYPRGFLSSYFQTRYSPCMRRLSLQYQRQSKLSCPTETTRKLPVSSQLPKVRTLRKSPWPFLKVHLRILGLIGRGKTHFVQNKTTIFPTRRHSTKYERVAMADKGDPFLAPNQKLEDTKCFNFSPFTIRYRFGNYKTFFF